MTPLAIKERQQETLEQYMKLNEMMNEKNEKRVRALQANLPQKYLPAELQIHDKEVQEILKDDSSNMVLLDEKGNPKTLDTIKPSKAYLMSLDGKRPKNEGDFIGKSIEELKAIGFKEIGNVTFNKDPEKGLGRDSIQQQNAMAETVKKLQLLKTGLDP